MSVKFIGEIESLVIEPTMPQKSILTIKMGSDMLKHIEPLKSAILDVTIEKHRKRRSLNANSYAWVLVRKIANAIQITEDEVYEKAIRDYGQSTLIKTSAEVPFDKFYKHCDAEQRCITKGKEYVFWRVYKGSSEMNTQEMARLIDGLIDDAKALGIQVLTPDELRLIKERWKVDE